MAHSKPVNFTKVCKMGEGVQLTNAQAALSNELEYSIGRNLNKRNAVHTPQ